MFSLPYISSKHEPWYLVHCKAGKEFFAANIVRSQLKLFAFTPECKVRLNSKIRSISFFPGYFFLKVDLQTFPLSRINTTPGIVKLVEFGGEPQTVPSEVIETIQQRLDNPDTLLPHAFHPGDAVRMKNAGPLQDLDLIFVGPMTPDRRVYVLLNIMGRLKKVQVNIDTLEKT